MAQIGRKIYYELATGNVILETGERWGDVIETSIEDDFNSYAVLNERVPSSIGVIFVEYGADSDKFKKYKYHVDVLTGEIAWDLTPEDEEEIIKMLTLEDRVSEVEMILNTILGVD